MTKKTKTKAPDLLTRSLSPAQRKVLAGLLQHDRAGEVPYYLEAWERQTVAALERRGLARLVPAWGGATVELVHPVPAFVLALAVSK